MIRDKLKKAYSRRKFDANNESRKGELSLRYVGPYEVLKWVRKFSYELKLPSELASIHPIFHFAMLKKCIGDPISILPIEGRAEWEPFLGRVFD